MSYKRTINHVNIMSWNIQGLDEHVLNDDLFNSCLDQNDIIILTETWLEEEYSIRSNEFYSFHNLRKKDANARRSSGGICVLVRHMLRTNKKTKGITLVKENEFFTWVKLSGTFFKLNEDIYICATYIPPENSSFYRNRDHVDPYVELENDIGTFQAMGNIIIVGDFNARTANKVDYSTTTQLHDDPSDLHAHKHISILESLGRIKRFSSDTVSNKFGTLLLDICKSTDMRILNGRTLGDISGAYTSFQFNGQSVVDYIIVSEKLAPNIRTMKVSPPNHLSDHANVTCTLYLDDQISNWGKLHSQAKKTTGLKTMNYKWHPDSNLKFKNALDTPIVENMMDTFVATNHVDSHQCCKALNNIIFKAASLSLKVKLKKPSSKIRKDKLGFDKDCHSLKNEVLNLGKLVKKYPKDPVIYGNFRRKKTFFKKFVKIKYKEMKNILLNKIVDSEERNPQVFWKLLSKLRNNRKNKDSPIPLCEWKQYFDTLHNEPMVETQDKSFTDDIVNRLKGLAQDNEQNVDLLAEEISLQELIEGIKKMKVNKSCGPDNILNEMLKAGGNKLRGCILKLFNKIINTEISPEEWATAFIVPLHKGGSEIETSNYRGISITNSMGKLFASILCNRLNQLIHEKQLISKNQIGFMKNKRTSDHLFVLKALIEEHKTRRKPIYACFVDLKKAYDTVWREGLFFKLLYEYKINPKFVRILISLYQNLHGCVKINGEISDKFKISIGLRQGCNLSPMLFNLYIDDLNRLLIRANNDPVTLNGINITSLMYADDMMLLSSSESGLQKSLNVLSAYCEKWQLVVNTNKTKIMIFNRRSCTYKFTYLGKELDAVNEYTYLGLKISKSGSFNPAIKELSYKAFRAYLSVKSALKDCSASPRLYIKLFDSVVKPILLYASEVWGGFGIKTSKQVGNENLFDHIMMSDKTPFEKLNIKLCKQSLRVSRRISNVAAKAELGRFPVMKSIIVAILKYYMRLKLLNDGELVFNAFISQQNMQRNCYNTLTYCQACEILNREIGVTPIENNSKPILNKYGKKIKDKCIEKFKVLFKQQMLTMQNTSSKLLLYSYVKKEYSYERYLDSGCQNLPALTKFRMSLHWLPIERGRYHKPKIPRRERFCIFCRQRLGSEFHVMMECKSDILKQLRTFFLTKIYDICQSLSILSPQQQFIYIMTCGDMDIISNTVEWVTKCNEIHKLFTSGA